MLKVGLLTMYSKTKWGTLFYERIEPDLSNKSHYQYNRPVSYSTLDQWSALCAAVPCSVHAGRFISMIGQSKALPSPDISGTLCRLSLLVLSMPIS